MKLLPDIPHGVGSPFYYNSLSSLTLFYRIPIGSARLPDGAGAFNAADFDGAGLASIAVQRYLADFGEATVVVTEVELAIVVVPAASSGRYAGLDLREFLEGQEQSLGTGHLPVAVACDAEPAVTAGRRLFGEPKFLAQLTSRTPAANTPENSTAWSVSYRRDGSNEDAEPDFAVELDTSGLSRRTINAPVTTTYGVRDDGPVGSRWSVYQAGTLYDGEPSLARPTFRDGDEVVTGFGESLTEATFAGAREHRTEPVAARGRPFAVL